MSGSAYQLKANASSIHIAGIAARTSSTGEAAGGAVPYFAESACPALTRNWTRLQALGGYDDLSAALQAAETKAGFITGRKVCKTCRAAAKAQIEVARQERAR